METLSPAAVDPQELDRLDQVVAELPTESHLAAALQYVAGSVRGGMGVTLAANDEHLTPAQAAQLLKMSRTHIYKLLDSAVIRSIRVGRDRRIAMSELLEYDARRRADRIELAESFAHAPARRDALLGRLAQEAP